MSNNIFYDPYNEIRCDRFALEKLVKESEAKDQRIAELEEQLKNCIRPKFKVGQEIWCVRFMKIIKFKINKIEIYRGESEEENRILYGNWEDMTYQIEENCFETKEKAQAKLLELKGEKK